MPVEYYPSGRPPLTPEQSRRAYERLLGVDPSLVDADELTLKRDDFPASQESGGDQDGVGSVQAPIGDARSGWKGSGPGLVVDGRPGGMQWDDAFSWVQDAYGVTPSGMENGNSKFAIANEMQGAYGSTASQGGLVQYGQYGGLESTPSWEADGQRPAETPLTPQEGRDADGGAGSHPDAGGWGTPAFPAQPTRGDGQQADGGGKDPKEAPSPHGTTLVTTYSKLGPGTVGDHTALYIRGRRFLYDPAGSFRGGERGSLGIFDIGDLGFEMYVNYHKGKQSTVYLTKIPTTPSEEDEIISRAENLGSGWPGTCTKYVSAALKGICGIREAFLPSELHAQAERASRGR